MMDTRNMTFNTTNMTRNYPTIPQTSFTEVVKRDYVE